MLELIQKQRPTLQRICCKCGKQWLATVTM